MNLDQRNDDQPIRSGELPVVAGPSEDLSDLPADDEFEETPFSKWILPISLFVATIFTTLWAGAYQAYDGPIHGPVNFLLEHPETLWRGIPFAATLLIILVTHEFGHYVLSRIHRVPASLPLFIPGPPYFIGTFGAIIRLRGPILNRRALFDIGVAGPIGGFIMLLPALWIGLQYSWLTPIADLSGQRFGEPLLFKALAILRFGSIPAGYEVVLHPIGFAAWWGMLATALNLMPFGQLDGGHLVYALLGRRAGYVSLATLGAAALLTILSISWISMAVMMFAMAYFLGIGHPRVIDEEVPLDPRRRWVAAFALLMFIVCFTPIPVEMFFKN